MRSFWQVVTTVMLLQVCVRSQSSSNVSDAAACQRMCEGDADCIGYGVSLPKCVEEGRQACFHQHPFCASYRGLKRNTHSEQPCIKWVDVGGAYGRLGRHSYCRSVRRYQVPSCFYKQQSTGRVRMMACFVKCPTQPTLRCSLYSSLQHMNTCAGDKCVSTLLRRHKRNRGSLLDTNATTDTSATSLPPATPETTPAPSSRHKNRTPGTHASTAPSIGEGIDAAGVMAILIGIAILVGLAYYAHRFYTHRQKRKKVPPDPFTKKTGSPPSVHVFVDETKAVDTKSDDTLYDIASLPVADKGMPALAVRHSHDVMARDCVDPGQAKHHENSFIDDGHSEAKTKTKKKTTK